MIPIPSIGKTLIIVGAAIVLIGLLLTFFDKIPFLGKLPGDLVLKRKGMTIYFPIVTSIVLSIILSIILNLFGRK